MREVDDLRGGDRALLSFDAPIGLPKTYLRTVGAKSFVDWLMRADLDALFDPVTGPDLWSTARPFVRPVKGGWNGVVAAVGHDMLWRAVDCRTSAESVFKLVGPKQVGRAAQELWRELRNARNEGREFRIWPFETGLDAPGVVVAEIYPRIAYREAVGTPFVAKRDRGARAEAIARIDPRVRLVHPEAALESEDDFDAAVTAIAMLRRLSKGKPLVESEADSVYEGGMLLT